MAGKKMEDGLVHPFTAYDHVLVKDLDSGVEYVRAVRIKSE
ncbi:MAG: hypothetical protein WC261_06560 [Synergistaceae bacterium]